MKRITQPWIGSSFFDLTWIIGPPLAVSMIVLLFPNFFNSNSHVSPWMWLILVVGVDVSHVYSTLYRTYFDSSDFQDNKSLYTTIPIVCWVIGVMLYSIHALLFWSILAYVAVFHFVRQQYGFMMIYTRQIPTTIWERRIDQIAIYAATLYPLIYWHAHTREFQWFVEGDFVTLPTSIEFFARWIYIAILVSYMTKEIRTTILNKFFNLPKNLLLIGSAASWYIGIVMFNADLSFTFTNVLAHGVPYMAFIWLYGRKKWKNNSSEPISYIFRPALIGAFILILMGFAYVEEGLWDGLVWKDHGQFFGFFNLLPQLKDASALAWVVPLLATPQATHYVLDGFIWRFRKDQRPAKILFEGSN